MSENHVYPVSAELAAKSLLTNEQYLADYAASINDPEAFWGEKGKIEEVPYEKKEAADQEQIVEEKPKKTKAKKADKEEKKDEREKPLLFKRHKVVRFLISPKNKKMKIEVNKIMNPAFLLGTAFNIAYWHRKYHSGTICKGVSNPQTSNALSGCEKEEIPK